MEPYRQTADDVVTELGTDAQSGLTEGAGAGSGSDATAGTSWRRKSRCPHGGNFSPSSRMSSSSCCSSRRRFPQGCGFTSATSALPYEAMAIFAIVLLNALMGYVQQARAEQALAALRQMSAAHANVIRDGARQSIPATELVPGDIILVEEGDTVPGRRATDPVHRAANGGGGADRREPAGVEGHRRDHAERRHSATVTT